MYVYLPNTISLILITMVLMVSAYIDYHSMEIPLETVLCGFFLSMVNTVLQQDLDLIRSFLGLGISLLIFLPLTLTHKCGGGDLVVMALLGWCLTANGILYVLIFSITIYILMGLYTIWKLERSDKESEEDSENGSEKDQKKTKKEALQMRIPFIPAVFFGWLLYLILGICVSA